MSTLFYNLLLLFLSVLCYDYEKGLNRGENMSTAEKIKEMRKKAGLSQKELGEKLGVSQVMISAYESGIRKPKIETLQKIAAALNVSLEVLDPNIVIKTLTDIEKAIEDLIDINDTLLFNKLVTDFDKLNPSGKEEACKRVNELTEIQKYTE